MSEVISKFKCESITYSTSGGEIRMNPVQGGSPENDVFFKFTPYGEIRIGTISEGSLGIFTPGQEYYVTIRKADK